MKTLRYFFAIVAAMAAGAVASAQTQLFLRGSTGEINRSFSFGGDSGRNNLTWKTGSTGVFNAGSTLTVNGIFQGTPTGGTLDLSLVTVIGVSGSGGISNGDKGDITVGGAGASLTIDNGAVTLAKMADMATASLLGRNTAGTGAPEVLSAATARSLLGLNGAALLNVGTTASTVAAGDDSRITGAVQSTRTISTTSPLSGGGDMSVNRTLTIADAAADGTTKGAAAFTAGHFTAASGVISLANSGVTAGTHGNSTHTPIIQVDAQGRIVVISNTATSGSGGMGGNFTVTGNRVESSGNMTLASSSNNNIVLEPHGTGEVRVTGSANITGNLIVGGTMNLTTVNADEFNVTGSFTGPVFDNIVAGGTNVMSNSTGNFTMTASGFTITGNNSTKSALFDLGLIPEPTQATAAIDVTVPFAIRTLTGNETATISTTPEDGRWISRLYLSPTTGYTLTLPAGTWSAVGADGTLTTITTVAVPADGYVHLTVRYDVGTTTYYVYGYPASAGSGLSDGDKGDISVGGSGTTLTIDNGAVSLEKMANLAQDQFIGRTTGSTGAPETATITAAARTVLDDTTVGAMVNTLGGATAQGTGGLVRETGSTLTTPTLSGIVTSDGARVTTPNAMGALAVDVTKGLNTKSISADSTFTFSGTPATSNTWFAAAVTNSDTSDHTLTIPSSVPWGEDTAITTVTVPASSTVLLTWLYTGSVYRVTVLTTASSGGSVAVGDITGLGTGVATALAVNTGTDGAFVVRGSSDYYRPGGTDVAVADGGNGNGFGPTSLRDSFTPNNLALSYNSDGGGSAWTITDAALFMDALGGVLKNGGSFESAFLLFSSASPTTTSTGHVAFDNNAWASSRGAAQIFDGTASTHVVATQASDTPAIGDVPKYSASGQITWEPGTRDVWIIPLGDETTAITTGTAKVTFRAPYAATVTAVRASLTTVSSSGLPTFDINETGSGSILSTTLTIDASEKTSTTAATPAVISDTAIADDAEITIDIDTAGTGAAGAKVAIYVTRA